MPSRAVFLSFWIILFCESEKRNSLLGKRSILTLSLTWNENPKIPHFLPIVFVKTSLTVSILVNQTQLGLEEETTILKTTLLAPSQGFSVIRGFFGPQLGHIQEENIEDIEEIEDYTTPHTKYFF